MSVVSIADALSRRLITLNEALEQSGAETIDELRQMVDREGGSSRTPN